jgi:hypothetical protein
VAVSRPARRCRQRFHRPGPQAPLFDPELASIPWLHPQACAKRFRDGELPLAADGHDLYLHGLIIAKDT